MNINPKKIISIFLIELIILLPIAIADALNISNIKTEEITQISAKIKWETNNNAEGYVNYGTTNALGQTSYSPNFIKEHSISLINLAEDTTYYFEVTSNDGITEVTENNNNNLHQFTTLPKAQLFVNATIPIYYQNHKIDITGKSVRLARINIYVNNNPPRTLNADNNGNFLFSDINLNEGNNIMKLTAESQGQTVEKTYTIIVDTTDPIITLNEIPDIIGSEILTINGTVSEPVKISFYVSTGEEDISPPPKITNLTNTSVKPNKIELSWARIDIDDFEQYIIYRNGLPIGLIPDLNYNDYVDALANSNQTYTYEVAAMDKSGNIGEKSDPITFKTPEGGRTDFSFEAIDIYENINKPEKTITTENKFEEEIQLGKEDGFYKIKIEATDIAGNKWLYENTHLLDTKDPEIEIISPRTNAQIYESYADMVTIRGKTEPGSRVYLYVKRTPFGIFNKTWDIYGAPDQIQQIPESSLRANCRLEIQGEEQCRTHSDYETVADANGYFEFEDVDLTSMWAGAFRITEYPTGEPYYEVITERELKDFIESNLLFIAVDPAGRKGIEQVDYEIVTCWTSGMAWSSTSLVEYQSPTFLNVERLKEGTEVIYFYLNFTYHGRGIDGKITNLRVEKACGKGYLEEKDRYNYSCSILDSCTEKLSPTGKTAYIACPLRRLEGVEKWSDGNWESFIDAVKDEMNFPFKLTLYYDEEFDNKTTEYGKSHYLCTEVGYIVDATYINPRELLPDWLLYDFVDILNKSIDKLNDWIIKIRRILEWASIACMVSFFTKFVTQIYRRFTCEWQGIFKKGSRMGMDEQIKDECRQCIEDYESPAVLEKFNKNKEVQDIISDTCLEKCYPACAAAWKSEETLYQTYRWTCDRVFGHETPSKWTETVSTTQLYQKATAGSACDNDQSVRGKPLRAIKCKAIEKDYERQSFNQDDICFEIMDTKTKIKSLYTLGDAVDINNEIYEIKKLEGPSEVTYSHVIKQNENNYLWRQDLTCEEICKGEGKIPITKISQREDGAFVFETIGSKDKDEKQEMVSALCTTTNQCLSFKEGNRYIDKNGNEVGIKQDSEPRGYTKDCFYEGEKNSKIDYTGALDDIDVVSGDPDLRMECCCINSEEGVSPFEYYLPTDIETKEGEPRGKGSDADPEGLSNMKWSYRYYKMNYKAESGATSYDPNRYIKGRDEMACLGQNNWLYDGLTRIEPGKTGSLLVIDPIRDHIAAFQCIAISQILNRLSLLKNIMVAMENCLLTIRTTGEADSGVCKELFTQYICSFIWKVISFFRDGCLPFGKGIDFANSENKVLEAVSVGMKGVWDSVADSQQELASEYGNAQLNNFVGIGEEEVFRKVCLGAFGYDWEIDADSLLDIAYHTPYATLVQAILPSREYLTFDPTTYKSKYEYRSSWLVNPGCDLDNYEVYLTCVTRSDMYRHEDIDCSKQGDPYGINCDCLELEGSGPEEFFYSSRGRIKQNELQNIDSTQITDRIKTSYYRYDHLKFVLNVDRNYIKNKGDISKCFPTGHEDGVFYEPIRDYTVREIPGCILDKATGQFSCKQGASFFYEQGNAWFTEIAIGNSVIKNIRKPEGATYYTEDNQQISATVRYQKDERKQCLIARLMDKDLQTVKETIRPIELREGELSGEELITIPYAIGIEDIGGQGYGFTIDYLNENQEMVSGKAKLRYIPVKPAENQRGGGPLTFIDADNDGKITLSYESRDKYDYGTEKLIKECYSQGACHIKLEDLGTEVVIRSVEETASGKYEYFINPVGKTESQATTEPRFYLHLDLRHPKTPTGSCDEVRGVESDKVIDEMDTSQIVIANGIMQEVDIPIYVLPGKSGVEGCKTKYQRDEIRVEENGQLVKKENVCACEDSKTKDCPTSEYEFCYGTCRKYKRCEFNNVPSNEPCVCNPKTPASKFDCGNQTSSDAYFSPSSIQSTKGWYCYEDDGVLACREKYEPSTKTTPAKVEIGTFRIKEDISTDKLTIFYNQPVKIEVVIKGATSANIEVMGKTIPLTQSADNPNLWTVEWTPNIKGEVEITVTAGDKQKSRKVIVTEKPN